jgi:hypothetical protein
MMPTRAFAATALLAALAVAAPAADRETVTSQRWGFELTFPVRWDPKVLTEGSVAITASVRGSAGVTCTAHAEKVPDTAAMTQAQINAEAQGSLDEAWWTQSVFGGMSGLIIESRTSRAHPSGIHIPEAVASVPAKDPKDGRIKLAAAIFITPGTTFSVSCGARAADYPLYERDFRMIVDSFRLTAGPANP